MRLKRAPTDPKFASFRKNFVDWWSFSKLFMNFRKWSTSSSTVSQTGTISTFRSLLFPPQISIPDKAPDANPMIATNAAIPTIRADRMPTTGHPATNPRRLRERQDNGNPLVETAAGPGPPSGRRKGTGKERVEQGERGDSCPAIRLYTPKAQEMANIHGAIQQEGEGDGDHQQPLVCPNEGTGDPMQEITTFPIYFDNFIIHRKGNDHKSRIHSVLIGR